MRTAVTTCLVLWIVSLNAGCGGSATEEVGIKPLNPPEQRLAGTYHLSDFAVFQVGDRTYGPADFELWTGELVLREDRYARVQILLRESGAVDPRFAIDREFAWKGETGLIHLFALDTAESDALLSWESAGFRGLATTSLDPTGAENVSLLLVAEGREEFEWQLDA